MRKNNKKGTFKNSGETKEDYFYWRKNRSKEFLRLFNQKIKGDILDIGCGNGSLISSILEIKDKNSRVFGFDINKDIIKEAQNNIKDKKVILRCGFNEKIPFEDESFDIAFSFDVLEHVDNIEKSMSENSRVLKKEGTLVLEMTPYYSLFGHHLFYFTLIPVHYFLKKETIIKWINFKKKNKKWNYAEKMSFELFQLYLNKITLKKFYQSVKKTDLYIIKEKFIFKFPGLFNINLFWVKHIPFLRDMFTLSYFAVLKKKKIIKKNK
jgi:ubiquinone/menaquinone biosynthesis C-methylase UbiE